MRSKSRAFEHHEGKAFHYIAPECGRVLTLVGSEVSDEDELGSGGFCIGKDLDTRLVVAGGHRKVGPFGGGCDGSALLVSLAFGRRSEVLLYLGLDLLNIEVTHGDDGHQVGPVPTLVVFDQALYGSVFNDFRESYRGPVGVARGPEEQ